MLPEKPIKLIGNTLPNITEVYIGLLFGFPASSRTSFGTK